jgi:hypothetical protein
VVPVVLVVLVFAFYPQFGLRRSEASLKASIAAAQADQQHSSLSASRGGALTASRAP